MKYVTSLVTSVALAGIAFATSVSASTLEEVQARGELRCGVDGGVAGFSAPNDAGKMVGIDASICDAVAAAVLGDSSKVTYVPLNAKERFTALTSGEIDMLSRNTTHTLTRDATLGVNFTYYNFIDGQGFMVAKDAGVSSVKDLDGASICVQAGTTTELNMADYFRNNGMDYTPVGYDTSVQTREGLEGGACDALTSDASQLAAIRSETSSPSSWTMLPEIISKEPLGPVVRHGDDQWADIVSWVLRAMMAGEEKGITSKNVKKLASQDNKDKEINRLLGKDPLQGLSKLGLSADWAVNVISQVGNYAESFERNLGMSSALKVARGMNALYRDGGLHYIPPIK